jgi:hypothetical protein
MVLVLNEDTNPNSIDFISRQVDHGARSGLGALLERGGGRIDDMQKPAGRRLGSQGGMLVLTTTLVL